MSDTRQYLGVQYAAALLAAPLFCWIYGQLFNIAAVDPLWIFHDRRALFYLVLFYPLIEEFTFRGIIQERMAQWTKHGLLTSSLSMANLLTSLLFVLMHLVYHEVLWALAVFFPSLIFGYFKERFGKIYPSIVLHMFYNLIFFSWLGN